MPRSQLPCHVGADNLRVQRPVVASLLPVLPPTSTPPRPKRPGQLRNKVVIPMEEFAGKVAAAREAIGDADFFLVARTDARGSSAKYGLEEAIRR